MDWSTLMIGAIIGGIITLPIAIFGNLITPWVKSYWDKSSLSFRERKIYVLKSRYRHIIKLINNTHYMSMFVFRNLALGVLVLYPMLVIGFNTIIRRLDETELDDLSLINRIDISMIGLAMLIGLYAIGQIAYDFNVIESFNKYREKTARQLTKLDGNPEELDRIDNELEARKII